MDRQQRDEYDARMDRIDQELDADYGEGVNVWITIAVLLLVVLLISALFVLGARFNWFNLGG